MPNSPVPRTLTLHKSPDSVIRHRAIFLSDTHLGTRACQAALLLDFLHHNIADCIYLVGDIIDGWQLKRNWYWDDDQDAVVHLLFERVQQGTRIIYIPGNHDEAVRAFAGLQAGGIEIRLDATHEGPNGQTYWITHGDQFDAVMRHWRWLAVVGDRAYCTAIRLNAVLGELRQALGLPYWSLSAWLKYKVKNAVEFISRYEETVAGAAHERGVDGVICGHIHHAEIKRFGDVLYMNDGDWVESCTALCEDEAGAFRIVRWTELSTEVVHQLPEREVA